MVQHRIGPDWTSETPIAEPISHLGPLTGVNPAPFDVETRFSTVRLPLESFELLVFAAKAGSGGEMPYVDAVCMSIEGQMLGDPVEVTLNDLDWASVITAARWAPRSKHLFDLLTAVGGQLAAQFPH